jgi:hypothetical protein
MKERELRRYANCSLCGKPIGHTHLPLFWRVSIERFGIDMGATGRQMGLTAMLGGSARLAMAMGADEDMAKPMMEKVTLSVCEHCAMDTTPIAALAELPDVLATKGAADERG